jgi:hypothetical protein
VDVTGPTDCFNVLVVESATSTVVLVGATPACLATSAPVALAGILGAVPAAGVPTMGAASPCLTSAPGAVGDDKLAEFMGPPMSAFLVGSVDTIPSLARNEGLDAMVLKYPVLSAITKLVPKTATAVTIPAMTFRRAGRSFLTFSFNKGCSSILINHENTGFFSVLSTKLLSRVCLR